jgi:hypothetical protein
MNRLRGFVFLLATSTLLAGCSSATTTNGAAGTTRSSQNQLSRDDLAASNADNVYDAVAKLRPNWLSSRGVTSVTDATPTEVDVYMDGNFLGKSDYLKQVRTNDIVSVTYWDAGRASARFGMGHPRGVIEIVHN